jgi:hypothetical protein
MLLNLTQQFLRLAVGALEFIAGERGPLLFQLAFDDVNVALDFEFCHKFWNFGFKYSVLRVGVAILD